MLKLRADSNLRDRTPTPSANTKNPKMPSAGRAGEQRELSEDKGPHELGSKREHAIRGRGGDHVHSPGCPEQLSLLSGSNTETPPSPRCPFTV